MLGGGEDGSFSIMGMDSDVVSQSDEGREVDEESCGSVHQDGAGHK